MNNKVLLSMLAAGVTPVVAFADAPVSSLSEAAKTVVKNEKGKSSDVELGTFAPGKYTVVPGKSTDKTTFVVNGGKAGELTVELKAAGKIVVTVSNADANWEVEGIALTHVYDYKATHDALLNQASAILGRLNAAKDNDATKVLDEEASNLQTSLSALIDKINALVDDGEAAYKTYCDEKLYEAKSKFDEEIAAADTKVSQFEEDVRIANTHAEANQAIKDLEAALKAVDTTASLKYWKTEGSYVTVNKALKDVNDAIQAAKDAIKADAEGKYTVDSKGINGKIDTLKKAIAAANADDAEYSTLVASATAATANYTAASKAIQNQIDGDKVYDDTYEAALAELRVEINKIKEVQSADKGVGTDAAHEGIALDAKDEANPCMTKAQILQAKLDDANAKISKIQTKYVDDIKAKQTAKAAADGKVKTLKANLAAINVKNIGGDKFNGKTINEYVAEINAAIAKLEGDIKSANEAHTIDKFDANTPAEEAQKLIDTLGSNADWANNNYDANQAVVKLAGDFNTAKGKVNALASGDYKANGRYADTEKGIQTKIDAITKTVTDAIKDGKSAGTDWKTTVPSITGEITTYQKNAEGCVAKYNQIVEAVAKAEGDMGKLTEKVTITSVVDGATGKTYATEIAALNTNIGNVKKALADALDAKSKDAAHISAINGIDVDEYTVKEGDKEVKKYKLPASIDVTIASMLASYDDDLVKYNEDVLMKTANTTLTETWDRYDAVTFPEYKAEVYGKSQADLNKTLDEIKADFAKITIDPKGTIYDDVDKAATAIANLSKVQTAIDGVNKKLGELAKTASEKKAAFDKNNADADALLNGATASVKALNEAVKAITVNKETGTVTAGYNKAATDAAASAISGKISTLEAQIKASKTAETIGTDAADTTDKDGKVTAKGYTSQISDINTEISNLDKKIKEESNPNYEAHEAVLADANYKALDAYDFGKLITDLEAAITGEGLDYYKNLVNLDDTEKKLYGYKARWNNLKVDVANQWHDIKAAANKAAHVAEAKAIMDALKPLVDNAKADEKANKNLIALADKVQTGYDEAYLAVSSQDESSLLQDNLTALAGYQKTLNGYKKDVENAFAAGNSAEQEASLTGKLNALAENIKTVKDYLNSPEYVQKVAADNDKCYEDFCTQVAKTDEAYREAVKLILALQKVETVDLKALLDAANKNIYDEYSQAILNLKKKAADEKEATKAPVVYDSERQNIKAANDMTAAIEDAAAQLQADADALANDWAGAALPIATGKYNAAVDAIKAAVEGKDDAAKETTAKNALKDVKAILDAVKTGVKGYAQNVDTDAANLATVDAKIAADKEAAAIADFAAVLAKVNGKYSEWKNALGKYVYADGTKTEAGVQALDNDYKAVTAAKEAEAKSQKAKTAFNDLQANKGQLVDFLSAGESTYNSYTDKAKNSPANLAALEKMRKAHGAAQAQLDAAKAYAEQFVSVNEYYNSVSNCQETLDAVLEAIDDCEECGSAATNETDITAAISAVLPNIAGIYDSVLMSEFTYLGNEVDLLRAKYNEAVAAKEDLTDAEKADLLKKIEAIPSKISAVNAAWGEAKKVEDDPKTKDVDEAAEAQAKGRAAAAKDYLALEKEIGELRTEISEIADAEATANAYAELNRSIDTWKSKLNNQPWHERTRAEFAEQIESVNAEFDAIAAEVEAKKEAKVLLLHQANLETAIADEGKVLDALYSKMGTRNAVFCDNDVAYERLTGELADAEQAIKDFIASIEGYDHVSADYEVDKDGYIDWSKVDRSKAWYGSSIYYAKANIAADKKWIEEANAKGDGLNANSKLDAAKNIVTDFAKYTVEAAKKEAEKDIESANNKWSEVSKTLNNTKLTAADFGKFYIELNNDLNTPIWCAGQYYEKLVDGLEGKDVLVDIDGNKLDKPAEIKDFTAEFNKVSAVMDASLPKLDKLNTNIKASAYKPGDINNDKVVDILDYTALLNITLGKVDTPAEGSREFGAADSNGDGKINVADLQFIKQAIRGTSSNAAPRKAPVAVEANDVMTVSVEGNMLYIGMNNSAAYTGLQMDITLPGNVMILSEAAGVRAQGMSLASNDVNGIHRVVLHTPSEGVIEGSTGTVVALTLSGNVDASDVKVANAVASDNNMRAHEIMGAGNATAIDAIKNGLNTVKQTIYDAGGALLNSMKKGVNILRGADGSTKKVYNK